MSKKKLLILFLIISITTTVIAQSKLNPIFGFGVTKRMGMIRLNDLSSTGNTYELFTVDIGLPQTYLSLDFGQLIIKDKFIVEAANYFTYSSFRYVRESIFSQISTTEYRFKHDHIISIKYQINNKRSKTKYFAGLGFGIMNLGTKFTYDIFEGFDSNGNPILKSGNKGNFSYFAPRVSFGIKKYNVNAEVSIYSTRDEMHNKNPTILPEFKLYYNLKLSKRSKV